MSHEARSEKINNLLQYFWLLTSPTLVCSLCVATAMQGSLYTGVFFCANTATFIFNE